MSEELAEPSEAEEALGLLGGTFDPVHCAHVQLARDACAALQLKQVLWIPSGMPPHRVAPLAAADHRLSMVRLAIVDDPRFSLDDSEARSSEPSYTFTTLQRLRQRHGQRPLLLLLGADAFLGLAAWHRWRELFSLAHIAVATRPGYMLGTAGMSAALRGEYLARKCTDPAQLKNRPGGGVITFAMTPLDISATNIRFRLAAGLAVQDLLPRTVLDYIAAHHLYPATTPH